MAIGYTSWSVLLYLLLVMSSHGIGAMKIIPKDDLVDDLHHNVMNALKYPMIENQDNHAHAHNEIHTDHIHDHSSSHMDHLDPSLIVFLFLEDLKVGKRIPIYFPKRDPSSSPHFLPKEESDSIPFSLEQLPNLLQIFSFPQGSPQAQAMESTLRQCEVKPIKGESKTCATSLESMLDFVRAMLGLESEFKVVSTIHFTESTTILQNYTILEDPLEISGPKMVACHTMPYPYAIFYCHYQESESKVFKVATIVLFYFSKIHIFQEFADGNKAMRPLETNEPYKVMKKTLLRLGRQQLGCLPSPRTPEFESGRIQQDEESGSYKIAAQGSQGRNRKEKEEYDKVADSVDELDRKNDLDHVSKTSQTGNEVELDDVNGLTHASVVDDSLNDLGKENIGETVEKEALLPLDSSDMDGIEASQRVDGQVYTPGFIKCIAGSSKDWPGINLEDDLIVGWLFGSLVAAAAA
ncbi:hypothetical protein TEA_022501 [Camellia sinensis var. sinensis]|uniref:BURP domain-containing protein n=1 Tax=Camellia sinensis var. sinensis TaxID=542762 RepID=A0A4S4EQK9_CAMSN|nr:hypothetical protein TEA_022501 [Camellia sinensis var. sinensis]